MIIDENLLLKYGAAYETYIAGDVIFHKESYPQFYYQIVKGTVELSNYHEGGKECIHNILSSGQCFGESLLFIDKAYVMDATAKSKCIVIKLSKTNFFDLLAYHPEAIQSIFKCFSERLYYKDLLLFTISSPDPCFRIKTILDYYKEYDCKTIPYSYKIPFTRKQIGSLTNLCTETVVRAVKKMEKQKILKIETGKIYY